MSYSDILELLAHVTLDTSAVPPAQKAVDKVADDWVNTREKILMELPKVASTINRLLYATRRIMQGLNIAVDPLVDAVISGALAVISAAIAMQNSFIAMGPAGWILIAINAIFLFLAVFEAGKAIILAGQAKHDATQANEKIQSIQDIGYNFRAMMGGNY